MAGLLNFLFRRKEPEHVICSAVVPAAGSSTRMAGEDKLLLPMGDIPVLVHTLRALDDCPMIDEIVVATRADLLVPIAHLCKDCAFSKVTKIVVGGATRTESVLAGIRETRTDAALIAIHDGARPLVSQEVLCATIAKAAECGAAAPAVPLKDTVKCADGGIVRSTPDRAALFAVQTPQVFEGSLIRAALEKALEDGVSLTDDCAAVERLGMAVALTEGSYRNIKVTTPEDIAVGAALLEWGECR